MEKVSEMIWQQAAAFANTRLTFDYLIANVVDLLIGAVAMLLVVGIFLIGRASRRKRNRVLETLGLDGKIIYMDKGVGGRSFLSKKYRIAAKPDFILKLRNGHKAIVEYKSRSNGRLYDSDVVQVKATTLAVRESMAIDEAYVYAGNRLHPIPLKSSSKLYEEIRSEIEFARKAKQGELIKVYAKNPNQCRQCAARSSCHKAHRS